MEQTWTKKELYVDENFLILTDWKDLIFKVLFVCFI